MRKHFKEATFSEGVRNLFDKEFTNAYEVRSMLDCYLAGDSGEIGLQIEKKNQLNLNKGAGEILAKFSLSLNKTKIFFVGNLETQKIMVMTDAEFNAR